MSDVERQETVAFKKGRRQFRKRREPSYSDSDSNHEAEEDSLRTMLDDVKHLHKMRERSHGVSAESLAVGKKLQKEGKAQHDPLKLKTGGYVDLKEIKHKLTSEDMEQIGTTFAAETNRRDEDAEMLKYVETEMRKKKGITDSEDNESRPRAHDAMLYELPDHIKALAGNTKKTEDMLSNQMLSGIPEIDLGIETKISNIEKTEEAKQEMLNARRNRRDDDLKFVPTNMAVNFVQHNRFKIDDHNKMPKRIQKPVEVKPLARVGDADREQGEFSQLDAKKRLNPGEKATDDYHFDRFRKQMRRY